MPIPSFDELLQKARQVADLRAEERSFNREELFAKSASDFVNKLLFTPSGERETYIGSVDTGGQFTAFDKPQTSGLTNFERLLGTPSYNPQSQPGMFPVTQKQMADRALPSIFKQKSSLESTLGAAHPNMSNEELEQLYGVKGLTPTTTFNQMKASRGGGSGKQPLSTQGTIASGYASRDFVKEIFPDIADDGDIPVGEFQQRVGMKKTETAANQPKSVPSEQIDKISQARTAIKGVNRIKKEYFSLVAKGKSPVDPVKGRFTNIAQQFKLLKDEEQAKFISDVRGRLVRYLNELSGAAISPDEAKRLESRLFNIASTGEQFLADIDSVMDELQDSLDSRIETLEQANFKVGGIAEGKGKQEKVIRSGATKKGIKFDLIEE